MVFFPGKKQAPLFRQFFFFTTNLKTILTAIFPSLWKKYGIMQFTCKVTRAVFLRSVGEICTKKAFALHVVREVISETLTLGFFSGCGWATGKIGIDGTSGDWIGTNSGVGVVIPTKGLKSNFPISCECHKRYAGSNFTSYTKHLPLSCKNYERIFSFIAQMKA